MMLRLPSCPAGSSRRSGIIEMYRQESLPGQGLVVLTALDRVIIPWGRAGYIVPRLVTRTADSCPGQNTGHYRGACFGWQLVASNAGKTGWAADKS